MFTAAHIIYNPLPPVPNVSSKYYCFHFSSILFLGPYLHSCQPCSGTNAHRMSGADDGYRYSHSWACVLAGLGWPWIPATGSNLLCLTRHCSSWASTWPGRIILMDVSEIQLGEVEGYSVFMLKASTLLSAIFAYFQGSEQVSQSITIFLWWR